ncbi:type II toxin-antitoxin system RelB/DinJ family antitoxin [Levilactobacillus cerevisiae]|uniref:type II toxin-antitoxin system RelB/DinJ family antitoxin n=1 Tax=Levilactobacillus cerevisiae TaxID=1704076 RepID=UPI000F7AF4DA|nr:type II toxin-antitoxin system RelB/DinJ family antitoxin [Levilactobacillus cerevisiae]
MTRKKQRVQVTIDADLVDEVNHVLAKIGSKPTTLITALYQQVATTGEIPFRLDLTEREKVDLAVRRASQSRPTKIVHSVAELDNLYDDDDEY